MSQADIGSASNSAFGEPTIVHAPASRSKLAPLLAILLVCALGFSVWRGLEANRSAQIAIDELNQLATNPVLIDAVLSQNVRTSVYSQAQIAALDKRYIEDAKTGTGLVADMMATAPSNLLRQYVAGASGRIVFIMLMDAKGLNVASSRPTTDYFQGDEEKWQKTFSVGPGAIHWSRPERDYVTNKVQDLVSRTLIDPKTGESIGVLTIAFENSALRR